MRRTLPPGRGSQLIRRGEREDAAALAAICNHYVAEGHRVLREDPISPAEMEERLAGGSEGRPAYVLELEGVVAGYSYATPWWGPKVDPATLETTIYLAPEARGLGLGRALYQTLLTALQDRNAHTAIGCIALPNEESRALHRSLGFTCVTVLPGAAQKHGVHYDLECWARLLRQDS